MADRVSGLALMDGVDAKNKGSDRPFQKDVSNRDARFAGHFIAQINQAEPDPFWFF